MKRAVGTILLAFFYLFAQIGYAGDACTDILIEIADQIVDPTSVKLSPGQLEKWVQAHPEKFLSDARKIQDALNFVRIDDFFITFEKSVLNALATVPTNEKALIFVVAYDGDKLIHQGGNLDARFKFSINSGYWLTGYARKAFPRLRLYDVAANDQESLLKIADRAGIKHFIIIDDMAVNGRQLSGAIEDLLRERENDINIHIAIPYFGKYARMKNMRFKSDRVKIFWPGTPNMRRVRDLHLSDDYLAAHGWLQLNRTGSEIQLGTTIFEHKVPDEASFPAWLVKGAVPNVSGKIEREIPFIEAEEPRYRQLNK